MAKYKNKNTSFQRKIPIEIGSPDAIISKSAKWLFVIFLVCMLQQCRPDGGTDYLDDGYSIYITSPEKDLVGKKGEQLVQKINDWAQNDSFIVVFRDVQKNYYALDSADRLWRKLNPKDSLEFWIVEKRIDSIYGPLNDSMYKLLRKNLRVPDDLHVNIQNPRFER